MLENYPFSPSLFGGINELTVVGLFTVLTRSDSMLHRCMKHIRISSRCFLTILVKLDNVVVVCEWNAFCPSGIRRIIPRSKK